MVSQSDEQLLSRGSKRLCHKCGARFYDLNKDPFSCPLCHEVGSRDSKIPRKSTRPVPAALVEEVFQDENVLEPLEVLDETILEEEGAEGDFETLEDPSDLGEDDGLSEVTPHLEKREDL